MGDNAKPGTRGAIIEGDFRVLSTDKADDKNEAAISD